MFRRRFAFLLFACVFVVHNARYFAAAEDNNKCAAEKQKESIDRAMRSRIYRKKDGENNEDSITRALARKEQRSMFDFESRCGCLAEEEIRKNLGIGEESKEEEEESSDRERHFSCREFLEKYGDYVSWRNRVLSNDPKYERERKEAKYLVVKTAWYGLGLGHMGNIVAEWLAFAMQVKRVLFIEELAEWNVLDYFEGHLGMDLRYGEDEERMLRERVGGKGKEAILALGALGADESTCRKGHCRARSFEESKTCREHKDEDGAKPEICDGEKVSCDSADVAGWQCEPCLQCASDLLHNAKWVTIHSDAGIKPPSLISDPDLKNEELRRYIWQSGNSDKRDGDWDVFNALTTMVDKRRSSPNQDAYFPADVSQHPCLRCAFFALIRPRTELADAWGALLGSKAADSSRLQCLKIRTGYPESANCFPDDTPKSDVCMDQVFSHPTCSVSYQFHTAVRLVSRTDRNRHVTIKEALNCLASHKNATIHVATDAPVVADYVSLFSPRNNANIFIVPGTGVDLNNGYRDNQVNSFRDKMKVALDFYVQGWCDDTLMLSPSEYYVSAEMRTMVPKKFRNDDHHPTLCEDVFGFSTTYNTKETSAWSHAPTWEEKGLEARSKAKDLECYSGTTQEPIAAVQNTGKVSVGAKTDDELKKNTEEASVAKKEESLQNNRGNEGETTKVVEIDASTGKEMHSEGLKMDDIDPEFLPKDNASEAIESRGKHEGHERNQTLTEEEKKWQQDAHDAVMATIHTHEQKSKELVEGKEKVLDKEAIDRDLGSEERKQNSAKELRRQRAHPLNEALEKRRAQREAKKRINDIASNYDRILEVEEKRQVAKDTMFKHASEKEDDAVESETDEKGENDIVGEVSKIERNEDNENELEKISELEKMPLAEPNILVDIANAKSHSPIVNLFSPDNFGTFLFLVFVVLFLVVLAVVRRRRRKKMLLAANRAYLEGRNFIV